MATDAHRSIRMFPRPPTAVDRLGEPLGRSLQRKESDRHVGRDAEAFAQAADHLQRQVVPPPEHVGDDRGRSQDLPAVNLEEPVRFHPELDRGDRSGGSIGSCAAS